MRQPLDGLQSYDHLDSGAVGVGDDAPRCLPGIAGIDLGHDQRHVGVHAESTRIVDHDRTVLGDGIRELARVDAPADTRGEVDAAEIVVMLQQFDR